MKITTKGQVTIPIEIREELGLLPHTEVHFEIREGAAMLRPAAVDQGRRRGQRLVQGLRGRATVALSTDEILALTRGDDLTHGDDGDSSSPSPTESRED